MMTAARGNDADDRVSGLVRIGLIGEGCRQGNSRAGAKGDLSTMEIIFPLEFNVFGTPVSLQAKNPESRIAWMQRVKLASLASLPEGHFATKSLMSITLFYFPSGEMQGDIDNIIKPVLDALSKHIYLDDRQVERVWVQKFEPGRLFQFNQPSRVLIEALEGEKPILFIRLSTDSTEGLF